MRGALSVKHIAAGIHHRNDNTGQGFAKREGCCHGEQGNGIDAHAARQQGAGHGDDEREQHGKRGRPPDP